MGIFSENNRVKGQSSTATIIAKGCTVKGKIKVETKLQIDGKVEGEVDVANQLLISKSGYVEGEINTKHLIINGKFEGICHADFIQILSCGNFNGTIFSDNLSIEPGGKLTGIANPSEKKSPKPEPTLTLDVQDEQQATTNKSTKK